MENFDEASEEIKIRRKKRAVRVIITEGLMTVAVICLVVFATMIATGYNVNPSSEDGLIERTGLVAIQTVPTGASVLVDGSDIFGWTNLSRSMTNGDHEIVLYKDGYDSWSKKINVSAGLYYRLNYPRLFLSNRPEEEILSLEDGEDISFAKDGNIALLYSNDSNIWRTIEINNDEPKTKELDLKRIIDVKDSGQNSIEIVAWSGNNEKVLMKINDDWVIVDVKNVTKSVNISQSFGLSLSDVRIANDSASELYAVVDENLRKINLDSNEISGILIKKVQDYYQFESEVVYIADDNGDNINEFGLYDNDEKSLLAISDDYQEIIGSKDDDVESVNNTDNTNDNSLTISEKNINIRRAVLSEYYNDSYLSILTSENDLIIYREKTNGNEMEFEQIYYYHFDDTPSNLEVRGDDEIIVVKFASKEMTYDLEGKYEAWVDTPDDCFGWVDEFSLFEITDGTLVVSDFDGQNIHKMSDNAEIGTEVKISKDNKWLYFISGGHGLNRVKILE